jgi:hypothetical protein
MAVGAMAVVVLPALLAALLGYLAYRVMLPPPKLLAPGRAS